jgi:RNA-directed DNA polymerase
MGLMDWLRSLFGTPRKTARGPIIYSPPTPPPVPPVKYTRPEQRETRLQLDAAQFSPLSEDEARARAQSTVFTGFFEFGRRDRIPSPLDPRTKLIDQAMVGQGLLSPDELVRIHEIGQRMDELRPDLVGAHTLAQRAVEASREERARIKAEKKAAAEQRKREHAERVAHRKATDIIHLGRGVSAKLIDRQSDDETLARLQLPILHTPADVAAALGMDIRTLRWLAFHAEASTVTHYVHFQVAKKSGGTRTLSAPHEKLAAAQRWVLDHVLSKLTAHAAAHGFVPGRSILTNATPHVGRAVVLNLDLIDFFPSISVHRVIGFFQKLGYSGAVATILALLVTECPRRAVLFNGKRWHVATAPRGLPQGACTSPAVSNLIARRLDSRLTGIAAKLGFAYTRYADDLTFSCADPSDRVAYLLARVRHIASDEGFAVNEKKTRVLKRAARQTVTGIVVNDRPGVSRTTRRKLRAILHNARKTGLPAQNRIGHDRFEQWVGGMIAHVQMVNPQHAAPLRAAFDDVS